MSFVCALLLCPCLLTTDVEHRAPTSPSESYRRRRMETPNGEDLPPKRGAGTVGLSALQHNMEADPVRSPKVVRCPVAQGRSAISDDILSLWLRLRRPAGIEGCCHSPAVRNGRRQAARQQTGTGVFAEAGGRSLRWQENRERKRGGPWQALPLFFGL